MSRPGRTFIVRRTSVSSRPLRCWSPSRAGSALFRLTDTYPVDATSDRRSPRGTFRSRGRVISDISRTTNPGSNRYCSNDPSATALVFAVIGTQYALASRASDEPVNTFTIGFEEGGFSELPEAKLVAERFGTNHHELVVSPSATELLPRMVDVFDEPFADNSALPTYLISELASEHVKVVLSGEGGDELFGGYYWYVGDTMAPRIGPLATRIRPLLDKLPTGAGSRRLDDRLKRFSRGSHLGPVDAHAAWSQVFSPEAREQMLTRRDEGADPLRLHRSRYAETEGAEHLSRMQDIDVGTYLVDDILVKIDRASMAHSLESRVPYLDPVVAELALALPTRHKVRGLSKKRLMRRALAPLLPREIVKGRKRGFALPVAQWFRGPLEPMARDLLAPERVRAAGYLDPEAVTAVIDEHVSGREDLSRNLWGLVTLSLWLERNGA